MKIFIFETVDELTSNYHTHGGLVIIAKDIESALLLAKNYPSPYTWKEHENPIKLTEEEIAEVKVFNLAEQEDEQLFIFPDSGCC